jgi:hypothetical protein
VFDVGLVKWYLRKMRGLAGIATVMATVALATTANAQPADPYGQAPGSSPSPSGNGSASTPTVEPADPYGTAPTDPNLAESVAGSLVDRAQDLLDARELADAKQLAVEAIATSPNGPAAARAHAIIHTANAGLGVADDAPAPRPLPRGPAVEAPLDTGSNTQVHDQLPAQPKHGGRLVASVYSGLLFGTIGATIGTAFSNDGGGQATGGVIAGAVGATAGIVFVAPVLDRHYSTAQIRTIGAASLWGSVIGGEIADVSTGTDPGGESAREVLVGASVGGAIGALGGIAIARQDNLTVGDVALIDTFAGLGGIGGLTVGAIMQPAQYEAYVLNSAIGISAGLILGLVEAPQTNTTPRRMLRVAALGALGAAVPALLYPAGVDPQVVGRAYLGFRLTRNMDVGLDKKPDKDDAPAAVLGRSSDGVWSMNGIGVQPLSPVLDTHQRGETFTLLGGAF